MEYHTPGVYIREIDSGPKPITSVATSIPGFIGLFDFAPPTDAVAITGSDGRRQIRGKVVPQLVDASGAVKGDGDAATTALAQAFRLTRKGVKDVKAYFELYGAAKSGAKAPKFEKGSKGPCSRDDKRLRGRRLFERLRVPTDILQVHLNPWQPGRPLGSL